MSLGTIIETPKVFVASRNAKKIAEMERILAPLVPGVRVLGLEDVDFYEEPVEDAPTFEGNALLKVRAGFAATGLASVSDDSGLCVDALNGMPGVLSARWSGQPKSDARNNELLLDQLHDVPDERRGARYLCVMVYLRHAEDPTPVISQAIWRGTILHNPKGSNGFGYDPLFWLPDQKASAAELDAAAKNRLSHRGKAAKHLYSLLHDNPREV